MIAHEVGVGRSTVQDYVARANGAKLEQLLFPTSGATPGARRHPEQGFRTCMGILRLFRGLAADRAEAVSLRAVEIGVLSYCRTSVSH